VREEKVSSARRTLILSAISDRSELALSCIYHVRDGDIVRGWPKQRQEALA
jgi:hypothetical protein